MPKKNNPGCCHCGYAGIICTECTNGDIPATLFLTDANGTITLTWNGVSAWIGCYTISQMGLTWNGSTCVAATVTVAIGYGLSCPTLSSGKFRLAQTWSLCAGVTTVGGPGHCVADQAQPQGPGGLARTTGPTALSAVVAPNCLPLNLTFTIAGSNTNGTVIVTE